MRGPEGLCMPLYEYECQKCGERFEVIQKFSDPLLTTHETCGGELKKLLSAPAIQFKGTGWYVTDYARSGKNGASGGDSSKSEEKTAAGKSSESTASDSKAESKSESKSSESKSSSASDSSTATTTAKAGDSSKK